ncbi:TPM domain-containing protein [Leptospira kanakyensis]|uniref:TPM domain-containing protein n=1 Tax=Leptospira kanakyensis TaxID=2484968 RepID=A0A6N4QD42_9LEPT|nr:TPM domain-containing protein [Leptospira kanakyensis]TGK64160.1 TPM domain-containing protein [Leptospira kanakyensis]TGK69378.1 TPM domain-containing protein [Leptospira kanakyensis]
MKLTAYITILIHLLVLQCSTKQIKILQPEGYFFDESNIFQTEFKKEISDILDNHEKSHGVQIVVHSTNSLNGLSLEEYSLNFANQIKVGQKYLNNGALITIAPNDRKVRIEIGSGLEWIISDNYSKEIVKEMIPFLRIKEYEKGIRLSIEKIISKSSKVSWKIENKTANRFNKNDLYKVFQFKAKFISEELTSEKIENENQNKYHLMFEFKKDDSFRIFTTIHNQYQLEFLKTNDFPLITGRLINLDPLTFQLLDFD